MTRLAVPIALLAASCAVSSHSTRPASLGAAVSSDTLVRLLAEPGPVVLETVVSADWAVTRAGLINLDHPRAKAAGLVDGDEPIQVAFHVLRHPTKGTWIVDTGVERALRDSPDTAAVRGMIASFMKAETMKLHVPLADFLAKEPAPLAGVLLTHLHLDHVLGLPDVPRGTPIYAGPGELEERAFLNLFVQPSIDRAFEGHDAINELAYQPDPAGRFAGVIDLFGDGSAFALSVPGHTAGNTAFLVRTPAGPVLLTGDACHTTWGWEHDVEPGNFSDDGPRSVTSLAQLRALAALAPGMDVRVGHQQRPRNAKLPSE